MSHQQPDMGVRKLDVRVREDPLRTWVTPIGELDLAGSPMFDLRLWEAQTASRSVVLDLRALQFIDSAGLRSIVGARLRAARWRRHLEVICGSGQVRRMLSLSGHEQLIQVIEPPPERRPLPVDARA